MKVKKLEFLVGSFLLIGLLCFSYFAVILGGISFFGVGKYPLQASFTSVSGLKKGANVEISGVKIGKVEEITLKKSKANIIILIDKNIKIEEDSSASIRTKGLIGEKYISISKGAEEEYLNPGDEITETDPSIDIEELIGKFIYSK